MKKPLALGLVVALAGAASAFAVELVLPEHPGTDMLPATKANLQFQDAFGQLHSIECAGPIMVGRGAPDPTGGSIPTEILELNLHCSGGVSIHLNPTQPSRGLTTKAGDSFFDVFVEIDGLMLPSGSTASAHNQEPVRIDS